MLRPSNEVQIWMIPCVISFGDCGGASSLRDPILSTGNQLLVGSES
jgi:hypothetical protein